MWQCVTRGVIDKGEAQVWYRLYTMCACLSHCGRGEKATPRGFDSLSWLGPSPPPQTRTSSNFTGPNMYGLFHHGPAPDTVTFDARIRDKSQVTSPSGYCVIRPGWTVYMLVTSLVFFLTTCVFADRFTIAHILTNHARYASWR